MIHSIAAIWFATDWWEDGSGMAGIWASTRGIRTSNLETPVWGSVHRFDGDEATGHTATRNA